LHELLLPLRLVFLPLLLLVVARASTLLLAK
jgi:hypothetical protein